ncbi:MAG: YccF domain-containing protein [Cystobacter sp.]
MRLILNILWMFLGGGFLIALEYLLGGLLLCLTVVGIPFGLQCFKLAGLGLFPFGKDIVDQPSATPLGCVLNVFWIVVAGVWIFLSHIALALGLAVTLIGIPFAIQHVKLALLALAPFGKRVRET